MLKRMVIENGVLRKAIPIVNLTEEQRKILRLPRRRMKVEIIEGYSNEYGFEMLTSFQLKTPKRRIFAYDMTECPEDATLSRDLSFVFSIEDMLKEAHEAGTKGIPLEFTYMKEVK